MFIAMALPSYSARVDFHSKHHRTILRCRLEIDSRRALSIIIIIIRRRHHHHRGRRIVATHTRSNTFLIHNAQLESKTITNEVKIDKERGTTAEKIQFAKNTHRK